MPHEQKTRYFPDQPDALDLGNRWKKLHSDYIYEWKESDWTWTRLVAPAGFIYNGASVPQIVWSIYPPHALDRAAVFHDLIYRRAGRMLPGEHQYSYGDGWDDVNGYWTRNAADTLFFKQLSEDPQGPGWLRRQAAYRAVRLFGGPRWG